MANGVIAIRGFDYQATIVLAELFDHFDAYGAHAKVRPEGKDDLDLHLTAGTDARVRHLQVKKPREDRDANREPVPWTLAEIVNELLPGTIERLSGNRSEQVWILGDDVDDDVKSLIEAGEKAPSLAGNFYWRVVHLLSRNEALRGQRPAGLPGDKLARAQVPKDLPEDPTDARQKLATEFESLVANLGAPAPIADRYKKYAAELHRNLPNILSRTTIRGLYGSEEEVRAGVSDRLERDYLLSRNVAQMLFRNLRGFINDISKQPGRTFDQVEFELELRSVWPHMVAIQTPPLLPANFIGRSDLTDPFTTAWTGRAIEVVGTSGSGKTMLASAVLAKLQDTEPDRVAFYLEVRADVTLRDVLVGIAFHLRRVGVKELFSAAIESGKSREELLRHLAQSLSALHVKTLLLIDLVDGTCTPSFARDLAVFTRELSSFAQCRLAIFGQEGGLRQLTDIERQQLDIKRLDIRGFSFEEFVTLVSLRYPNPDRTILSKVYHRVTAGRAAGLFAQLANTLAGAASLLAMQDLATMPVDQILPYAECARFNRLEGRVRSAAEKIVCFALPFERGLAEQIFPDDHIRLAIKELLELSLLRSRGDGSFEMHEAVRAGLEGLLTPNSRRAAHRQLATWYETKGPITAQILHLDKANEHDAAHELARTVFLQGKHWGELSAYIQAHKLVTADEVIQVLAGPSTIDDSYLLSDILRGLGGPSVTDDLIQVLRDQRGRHSGDYQWALTIVSAILEAEPSRFDELLSLTLEDQANLQHLEARLAWLLIGARRRSIAVGPPSLARFAVEKADIKKMLVPLLALDWRRDVLRPLFLFLASDKEPPNQRRNSPYSVELSLRVRSIADTQEFLAALPLVKTSTMLIAKSSLLGPLVSAIWSQRKFLREHCVAIIGDPASEDVVAFGAVRVLVVLADPSICKECEPLLERSPELKALAELVPALVPTACDRSEYEHRVLNAELAFEKRTTALAILTHVGADLGAIYRSLEATGEDIAPWEPWFIALCSRSPFLEAASLVERHMAASQTAGAAIIPALTKLAELDGRAVTGLFLRALEHPSAGIRQSAAMSLVRRRSRWALPNLIEKFAQEESLSIRQILAVAIVCCGAANVVVLDRQDASADLELWQTILAGRTRDASFSDKLVTIASCPNRNWQLRRAAIFAASKLPYEYALEKIRKAVLEEHSTFLIDESPNLIGHAEIAVLLEFNYDGVHRFMARGEEEFSGFFGEIFDEIWAAQSSSQGLPSGNVTARWLFGRLIHHGWPAESARGKVIDELHVPILRSAVLRGFRLLDRPDLIEAEIPKADSAWFAMKCLLERSRAEARDPQLAMRLTSLLEQTHFCAEVRLKRSIEEIAFSIANAGVITNPATANETAAPPPVHLGYQDVLRIVSEPDSLSKPAEPIVLDTLQANEFAELVRLLDPINDYTKSVEQYVPAVQFTTDGFLASRRSVTTTRSGESARTWLRPALAAANRSGVPIPWHEQLLGAPYAGPYVSAFITCLGAQGDRARFYEEIDAHGDLILPYLASAARMPLVRQRLVDQRIVPFLWRYASVGTDEIFEGLCSLALGVTGAEIDPVLAMLFARWVRRFDLHSPFHQHRDNFPLWRGFDRLSEHPRFEKIEGWQSELASVIRAPMSWYHLQTLTRVLERDPRSYCQIEAMLVRTADWEHFREDEADRLERAAGALFAQTIEE